MAATEHNGWIHAVATTFVIAVGIYLRLSLDEWRWIILAIGLVWPAEAMNTAIERVADAITIEPNENIRYGKDVAAGGVLTAAIVSAAIGLTIFVPHLMAA